MTMKKKISLLIIDKGEKNALPKDPPLLKDAPEIDSLFKRVTTAAGHKEEAYLVLKNQYQQIKNSHYETKKGEWENQIYLVILLLSFTLSCYYENIMF